MASKRSEASHCISITGMYAHYYMTVVPTPTQDLATPTRSDVKIRVRQDIDGLRDKLNRPVGFRGWTGLLSRVSRAKALPGSNSIEGNCGPGRARHGRRRGPAGHLP
jgi:hypothetical protein